jgi:hypothetical protein
MLKMKKDQHSNKKNNISWRVSMKYLDDKKEYDLLPENDSGWYQNKEEFIKTVRAFLE